MKNYTHLHTFSFVQISLSLSFNASLFISLFLLYIYMFEDYLAAENVVYFHRESLDKDPIGLYTPII